jgi:serine/threonine protein kinase
MVDSHPVLNDRYILLKELGDGATSKVYSALDSQNNNQKFAIKVIKKDYLKDVSNRESLVREIEI